MDEGGRDRYPRRHHSAATAEGELPYVVVFLVTMVVAEAGMCLGILPFRFGSR